MEEVLAIATDASAAPLEAIRIDALALGRERVESLRASLQASEAAPVRLIETHISWVLLAKSLAYKLKKPVQLPFLDSRRTPPLLRRRTTPEWTPCAISASRRGGGS